jgi:hypothetical protein
VGMLLDPVLVSSAGTGVLSICAGEFSVVMGVTLVGMGVESSVA